MEIYPDGIEISNAEQTLEIKWSDGKVSIYPLRGLRINCPCAVCRGGHSTMGEFEPEAFFDENPIPIHIMDVSQVGNHALKIVWSDGHDSGMYRWNTLRFLDPDNHREDFEQEK